MAGSMPRIAVDVARDAVTEDGPLIADGNVVTGSGGSDVKIAWTRAESSPWRGSGSSISSPSRPITVRWARQNGQL